MMRCIFKQKSQGVSAFTSRLITVVAAIMLVPFMLSCRPAREPSQPAEQTAVVREPSIEAEPIRKGSGDWMVADSDKVTFTVTAATAEKVNLLYRPVAASGGHFLLKAINAPNELASGRFEAQVVMPLDFYGEVWAEAVYPDGTKKQTRSITLMTQPAGEKADLAASVESSPKPNGLAGENESARSDKITGGKIEKTSLKEGLSDIKITVNVPAFLLTLWQNGKEVKTYDIGIGRKSFPVVIGEREATEIIFNPAWIPPDSEWVREAEGIEPYERIEPGDPDNPLGKLKIPLGDAYLIHEAQKPSDIGNLVSHGCIRMLRQDIFDLGEKIIAARNLPMSREEIERLKRSFDRHVVSLGNPLTVDINYDTEVVEGGILHIYPDVYDREDSPVEKLRAELQSVGIDISKIDDRSLDQMISRADKDNEFVVSIADVRAGRAPRVGTVKPLTKSSSEDKRADEYGGRRKPTS